MSLYVLDSDTLQLFPAPLLPALPGPYTKRAEAIHVLTEVHRDDHQPPAW
jgi:hypothetical protein